MKILYFYDWIQTFNDQHSIRGDFARELAKHIDFPRTANTFYEIKEFLINQTTTNEALLVLLEYLWDDYSTIFPNHNTLTNIH